MLGRCLVVELIMSLIMDGKEEEKWKESLKLKLQIIMKVEEWI